MLYFLKELSGVSSWLSPFNVFQYVTFRTLGAAMTAFLLCLWFGPKIIVVLTRLKMGQPIRGAAEVKDLAQLHGAKKGTPTMGGVLILTAFAIASLLWALPSNAFVWVVLVPTLILGTLGFIDDLVKVKRRTSAGISSLCKLLVQSGVALGVGVYLLFFADSGVQTTAGSLFVPFIKEPLVSLASIAKTTNYLYPIIVAGFLFFFALVIVGTSNAVNLTDGLDGLAVGCSLTVIPILGLFAYLSSHVELATYLILPRIPGAEELCVVCGALSGACLGFLWFNCHPARVFMGDTGSLALGGAIAVISICISQELLLVVIGGVFVMEAGSVILQVISYKLTGRRIFAMSPIHHHFELRGWKETTVVTRFWILSVVLAIAGLATLKLR